ncbi:hypothetical protein QQG55_27605 [Brugia pahangi]
MTTLMIVIDDLHEECCVTLSFDLSLVASRIENASNDLTMNSTYSKLFTFPFTVSKEKKEEIRVTSNLQTEREMTLWTVMIVTSYCRVTAMLIPRC